MAGPKTTLRRRGWSPTDPRFGTLEKWKARFWGYVAPVDANGCRLWQHIKANGYGRFYLQGRTRLAHRVAFEWANGPIPEGFSLDHLCRNRACVEPSHLEIVTNRENILRGVGITAENARKTHCVRGHLLAPIHDPRRKQPRGCSICKRERNKADWAAIKAKRAGA